MKIKFKKWQLELLKESLTYWSSEGKKKEKKMAKRILKKL